MPSDFDSTLNNNQNFDSIKNEVLSDLDEESIDEKDNADDSNFTIVKRDSENSQEEDDPQINEIYSDEDEIWKYRKGHAINETQREYEILRTFLEMGRSRSAIQLKRIFNLTDLYIKKVRGRNNWVERIDAYDRNTYLNALSEETVAREEEHRRKLEFYRAQQETLAHQSAGGAAKMMHLINRKLNKLVEDTDNLSIDEMVSVGNLSTKLIQLQKEIGAQALGVDALLEAIEDNDTQ